MEWFLQHRCQLFILLTAFTPINNSMGGAATVPILQMNSLSLGDISEFEPILDSELKNKNSHDCKMGLPCGLKPIREVIWGQAKKRETGIPAPPWSCGEAYRKGSSLCVLWAGIWGRRGSPALAPGLDAPLESEDCTPTLIIFYEERWK